MALQFAYSSPMDWNAKLTKLKGSKSWRELAERLGVTATTIHNIRAGRHEPRYGLLKRMGLVVGEARKD